MTQEELAKKAKVTQGYISQLESGAKKEIDARGWQSDSRKPWACG
jgi:transcriptional regulator with XRE-family HTH domain